MAIVLTSSCYAQTILQCLGKEENFYAKQKYTGPNYKLNQMMIEEMTSLNELKIKESSYRDICSNPKGYPSLRLLKKILLDERNLFSQIGKSAIYQTLAESIKDKAGDILIDYLTRLQATAQTPDCVVTQIPETKNLFSRYLHLREVLSSTQANGERKELYRIFSKLENVDTWLHKCKKKNN